MKLLHRNHIKYGLIMVAVTAVGLVLMEITGQNDTFETKSPFQLIFQFTAPAVIWYLGIKSKKKSLHNKLTYKQGLLEGFKISVVYAALSPFLFLLYYTIVNPGILNYVREVYSMEAASDSMIVGVDMAVQFVSALIFGSVYGAIIALFLRDKK